MEPVRGLVCLVCLSFCMFALHYAENWKERALMLYTALWPLAYLKTLLI